MIDTIANTGYSFSPKIQIEHLPTDLNRQFPSPATAYTSRPVRSFNIRANASSSAVYIKAHSGQQI
jgi:DNA-binding winged helix-turn-helix (wHTH) protein